MKKVVVVVLSAFGCLAGLADTWYANRANTGVQDGRSEATGFVKIQDAVNMAQDGDTVIVLPGTYGEEQGATDDYVDNSTATTYTSRSRVVISSRITLKSRDGAAKTTIAGRWHSNDTPIGENAVRGIAVLNSTGAVIEGFTVCNGSTTTSAVNKAPSYGGGILGCFGNADVVDVVDCVVSNCCCSRGGAMGYARAFRTLFVNNMVSGNYVLRNCSAYNCVFLYNGVVSGGQNLRSDAYQFSVVGDYYAVVNCTFIANGGPAISAPAHTARTDECCYNCLTLLCGKDGEALKGRDGMLITWVYDSVVNGTGNLDEARKVFRLEDELGAIRDYATGDFRPNAAVAAMGAGDVKWLEKIPAAYRDTDFYGKPRSSNGQVTVGAVQETVALHGGRLVIPAGGSMAAFAVNGKYPAYPMPTYAPRPILAETWPASAEIGVDASQFTTGEFMYWSQSGAWTLVRHPDEKGLTRFTLPAAGSEVTNTPMTVPTENVYYVDPKGDDDNDGSCPLAEAANGKGPFKTLQAAADAIMAQDASKAYVLHAAEGVYDEGGVLDDTHDNWSAVGWPTRLYLGNNKVVVRGAGPGKSIIKGRCDTSAIGQENYGCGPDAIRCVAFLNSSRDLCLTGFTLVDGCVSYGATADDAQHRGGGFWGNHASVGGDHCQLIDCVITNCAGSRGGALMYGWWQRCRVVACHNEKSGNTIYRAGTASSCVFHDNTKPSGRMSTSAYGFYHCLFDETPNTSVYEPKEGCRFYNNVFLARGSASAEDLTDATYYGGNWQCTSKERTGWSRAADLKLADVANKDYRPLADSPLVTGGSCGAEGDGNTFAKYSFESFDGQPLQFVDGQPLVGPYQRVGYKFHPVGILAGDISPTEDRILSEGETLEVTSPNATGKRQFLGYLVDGELLSPGEPTFALTAKAAYSTTAVELRALYNTNWYVNAGAAYSDTNDGWTPETARHSLKAAVADAVKGDVVHAAPGTYDSESMTDASHACPSRVILADGITLVGDEGAATTVIKGRIDTSPDADTKGRGPNGIRCVAMNGESRLMGFTLTDGRTGKDAEDAEPNNGGAIYASGSKCVVTDCVITNNSAIRSGGHFNGTFVRCRFSYNAGANNGNLGQNGSYYGCLAEGNTGAGWLVSWAEAVVGCTFKADNGGSFGLSPYAKVIDSICLVATRATGAESSRADTCAVLSNCVLSADCAVKPTVAGDNVVVEDGEAVLDENDVPVLGGKAIDKGVLNPSLNGYADGRDLLGTQRVYNGAQDIGAVERDWRGDYAARLGGGVTVTAASPEVVDSADGVCLPAGGELVCAAPATCDGKSRRMLVEVTGDGELAASLNGDGEKVFGKGVGVYRSAPMPGDLMEFRYRADAADEGAAYVKGFVKSGLCLVIK